MHRQHESTEVHLQSNEYRRHWYWVGLGEKFNANPVFPALYITDERTDLGLYLNYWMYPLVGKMLRAGDFTEMNMEKSMVEFYQTKQNPCDQELTIDDNLDCLINLTRFLLLNTSCSTGKI